MKITTSGSVISMDFEAEGVAPVSLDVNTLSDDVKVAGLMFGFQTAMRNATAGKLEEISKAVESVNGRIKTWQSGAWLAQGESRAAIELSDDEKKATIAQVLVMARRAQGDTRTDEEILAAFNGLNADRQGEILSALKKPIDKRLKDALRQKKALAKGGTSAITF